MRLRAVVTLFVLVVAGWSAATPAEAGKRALPLVQLNCGELVGDEDEEQKSFRLANNLECADDAIVVGPGAAGITIDLDGRRISGDDGATNQDEIGIDLAGVTGVTVRNGFVSGFDRGVLIQGTSSQNVLSKLTVTDNEFSGVRIRGGQNSVLDSTFVRNGSFFLDDNAAGNQADGNTIQRNVVVDDVILLSGADQNTIADNVIRDGAIQLLTGTDGSSDNQVLRNSVIGSVGSGIVLAGDFSDGNDIIDNEAIGHDGDGIDVADGDLSLVVGNRAIGNGEDGIDVRGSAEATTLDGNTSNGNFGNGVRGASTATIIQLTNSELIENGLAGADLDDTDLTTRVSGNIANGNGFLSGTSDDQDFGLEVADFIEPVQGEPNQANGNDVPDPAQQCSHVSLCATPATPDPGPAFLFGCNIGIAGQMVLEYPMDCPGDGWHFSGGSSLDAGEHRFSSGPAIGDEAIGIASSNPAFVLTGGVFARGGQLIKIAAGASNVTLTDVTVIAAVGDGVLDEGGSGHTFNNLTSILNGGSGVRLTDASEGHRFAAPLLDANGQHGLVADRSSDFVVSGGSMTGNQSNGISLEGVTAAKLSKNKVVGNAGAGIATSGSTLSEANTIATNIVNANGSDATGPGGIVLGGDLASGGVGSARNKVSGNIVHGNEGFGIRVAGDPDSVGNSFTSNKAEGNKASGIVLEIGVTQTKLLRNKAGKNGAHGIVLQESTNVKRFEENVASFNGFLGNTNPIDDDAGLGINAPDGTKGCGNKGKGNDDPDNIVPPNLKKPC